MEAMKAYVRASWEASQYVMRKAGIENLTTWRGVMLSKAVLAKERMVPEGQWEKFPDLQLKRNGAASATTDPRTANGWTGVGSRPESAERVVLRIKSPRTAVISLPCFGQNVHGEQEVILAGTMWESWDAWLRKAPSEPIK
jgi:hypothetical protein